MNIISIRNGKKLDINTKETYRYLGYHFGGEVPLDNELEKMVDELTEKLKDVITPRCIYEIFRLNVKDNVCNLFPYSISNAEIPDFTTNEQESASDDAKFPPILSINSKNLSAHIKECRFAILFAATIGPGADMLIRRYSGRSTIKPAILQAAGASAIEAFADNATEHIRKKLGNSSDFLFLPKGSERNNECGFKITPSAEPDKEIKFRMRFSPGYGDFSLSHQTDFFRLLSLEKNLGMCLNSALLMSPSKSITAVIGVL